MSRPRKLSPEQVKAAAVDRRSGMSWQRLSIKYKCAVNTLRTALAEYNCEFAPNLPPQRPSLQKTELAQAVSEIEKIKKALKKRFNLYV